MSINEMSIILALQGVFPNIFHIILFVFQNEPKCEESHKISTSSKMSEEQENQKNR